MIKRSQEQWPRLFTEQQASGLKASEFCRDHNICPNYFSKRKKELLTPKNNTSQSSPFVSVTAVPSKETAILALHYEHTILKIPLTVSPNWLADFIHQLRV